MSVKINGDDPTRVLVGMPFLNTVFLFLVSNNGTALQLASSSVSNQKPVGFGKSVTWLSSIQAAILYSTSSSSKVYVYTWLNGTHFPTEPTAVMPNAQQPLPPTMHPHFIRLISTPTHLGILDQTGGTMLILSESPGSYASTDTVKSPLRAGMPVISCSTPCMAGTFKADAGVHPCALCPAGSRNSNDNGTEVCIQCSVDAFCPLGAVYEVDRAFLTPRSQAVSYPRSPETTVFEDLLVSNMLTFGSTPHCLCVSPMFWTVVLLLVIVLILLGMASLRFCVEEPKRSAWRTMIKSVFLRTDLVVSNSLVRAGVIACPCDIPG